MNKKSWFLLVTCNTLFILFVSEILYLQFTHSVTHKELTEKQDFVAMATISNLNLAIKNNTIKIFP